MHQNFTKNGLLGRRTASCLLACFIAVFALAPARAQIAGRPLDIFTGTLSFEEGEVVLTRCDLASNRYILRDANEAGTITQYSKNPVPASAQVVGSYRDDHGLSILDVERIENLIPGGNCHLRDALDALTP